ncbi:MULTISPECIES: GntR family transcriptional regulator [Cytobacillus]|uniref:GntR family transcriptional regulator n=1 Tax=Cytobacillus stercorigallinarum TaxID=2762240 RepID=A0ABR8QL43_9BACI|nr:GntR family transcriptional regulator [Cytobacillus stercorigallinarum]MBD7936229.1 GntR family transcriptional regulator [Cytobacillus stercorigallinarum]
MKDFLFNNKQRFGESLPEQIAKYILREIMKGSYIPGDKIIEEKIAEELKTSRAPVREALYLLQVDNIVERIHRKGTVVKSFTAEDIKEYTHVMVGLIQMALDMTSNRWHDETKETLILKLNEAEEAFLAGDLIGYQMKSTGVTTFFFEVANNKALSKFYYESVYILTVFAQVKWTMDTMNSFHPRMKLITKNLMENKITEAKEVVPALLLETLE